MSAATAYVGLRCRNGIPVAVQMGMGDGNPRNYAIADIRDRWYCLVEVRSRRSQERADRHAKRLLAKHWPQLLPLLRNGR